MKRISKQQIAEREGLCHRLETLFGQLESAVEGFNESVAELWVVVDAAQAKYNEAIEDAQGWCDNIASEIQSTFEDHSERWQEGDTGQTYSNWQAEYENAQFETSELEQPSSLDLEIGCQAELLVELPEQP